MDHQYLFTFSELLWKGGFYLAALRYKGHSRVGENTELNNLRGIICLRKSEVTVKEFQFVMSLKF